jgi:hypothetical protein
VHSIYVLRLTELGLVVIGAPLQSCIGCTAGSTFLAFLVVMMLLVVDAALTPLDVIGSSTSRSRSYGKTMTACWCKTAITVECTKLHVECMMVVESQCGHEFAV